MNDQVEEVESRLVRETVENVPGYISSVKKIFDYISRLGNSDFNLPIWWAVS